VDSIPLVIAAKQHGHNLEGAICYITSYPHMGSSWSRKKILFHCDNQAVVEIWDKGSSRAPHTMGLVRLLFCASRHNINVCVIHIPGICNDMADCLSHFQMEKFRRLAPGSKVLTDCIPAWPTQSFLTASCNASIMELSSQPDELTNPDLTSSNRSAVDTPLPPSRHPP